MADLHHIDVRLGELEQCAREYLQESPVEKANASIEAATNGFNTWAESAMAALDHERDTLAETLSANETLLREIEDIARRMDACPAEQAGPEGRERRSELVSRHNALVQDYNGRIGAYQQRETVYNARVRDFNGEAEKRRKEVEDAKASAIQAFEKYQRWIHEEGPYKLWREVNGIYVALMQMARLGGRVNEMEAPLRRVRALRKALGRYARLQRDWMEGGVHVVETVLCDSEECLFLVDCGASVTAVSPEMVDVLGMRDRLGEKVKIDLPNAIRIEAPQLLLPKIQVADADADYVKAVVLKTSMPGIDGCLGLSFLDRFDYVIDNKALQLRPIDHTGGEPRFDVFISHRSDILPVARTIYDYLVESGHKPFLSAVSIAAYRTTDYQKAIDAALQSAEHLIVVGSTRAHFEAPWVEAEWRLFESCKRAGKKRGNIIPVLSGSMHADDLPFALGRYEVIAIDDPDWKKVLVEYLPRH